MLILNQKEDSQKQNGCGPVQLCETFRQYISLDLQRSRSRKILLEENDPVNPLIV